MSIFYFNDSVGRFGYFDTDTNEAGVLARSGRVFIDIAVNRQGDFYGISEGSLFEISFLDGTVGARLIGALPVNMNGLEFGEDGALYGSASRTVYRIDETNASSVTVGATRGSSDGDLFVDGGAAFVSTYPQRIERVDLSTGSATTVITGSPSNAYGLADTADGLFVLSGKDVHRVDLAAGSSRFASRIEVADTLKGATYWPDAEEKNATGVWRFFNKETGAHFFTNSTDERDLVATKYRQYVYEGNAFDVAAPGSSNGDLAVFRFYNTATGTHFYTASAEEKNLVVATLPSYVLEGVAYKAYSDSGNGAHEELYRFYNSTTGTHFYTADEGERDHVVRSLPQYQYEGVAYYVDSA